MKVTVRTIVPHPPEVVFDFVADMHNEELWVPLVENVQQTAGKRPGLGARYQFTQHMGAHAIEVDAEVTGFDRPSRLAWRMDHRAMDYASTMTFQAHPRGTEIRQTNIERWYFAPWHVRLMGPAMLRRQLRNQLALLSRAIKKERKEEDSVEAYLDSNSA